MSVEDMGYHPTEESLAAEKITRPILESKLVDELLEDKLFSFDSMETDKGYLIEGVHPIRILTPGSIIVYLKYVRDTYQHTKIYYKVEPYHILIRAAILIGPNLEQIFTKELFSKKHVRTSFEVYDDDTGEKLGRFELTIDHRDSLFFFNMALLRYPLELAQPVRYLHAIVDEKFDITHMDGEVHYYTKEQLLSRRTYSFDKTIRSMKYFRLDGMLPITELAKLSKEWLEFNRRSVKVREVNAYNQMLDLVLALPKSVIEKLHIPRNKTNSRI
ncbi:MAG: hypothetical protein WC501_00490 [Candidatus Micrarchaeia archaeon]